MNLLHTVARVSLRLDLRHYETIVAIVELGTMTAAARELSSSQSALSHRLAIAERRLGVQLFDRSNPRNLRPTRAGTVLYQSASRSLTDLARGERFVRAQVDGVTTTVRLAVGSYDCYHWYPSLLDALRDAHPWIEVQLVVGGDTPSQILTAGEADVVIAPGTPVGPVALTRLFEDELVLVVPPEHRLAGRRFVEPTDLIDENYLTYNRVPTPGFEFDRFIRPSDDHPREVTVVPQTSAITELVAVGAGVSILSRWALSPAIGATRVREVRCGPSGLPLSWVAATRLSEPDDSPAARIVELLRGLLP
jgi:LysR family transcriptional regulator for metE and metH